MYKRIDFSNLGGNPLDQQSFEYMQASYREGFSAIAALLGDKVIISGCKVVGGNVTDGWITYQGEIIKFIGGLAGADVVVRETVNYIAPFQDGSNRDEELIKTATIGAPGTFPFADLKPANVGVPSGTVVMWSGSVAAIPAGWQLHAPLAGKFIVGYDPNDVDYDAIGKQGGEKKHVLTVAEMPSHNHGFNTGDQGGQSDNANDRNVMVPGNSAKTTANTGGGAAHENRPPYYTLAYIIKL